MWEYMVKTAKPITKIARSTTKMWKKTANEENARVQVFENAEMRIPQGHCVHSAKTEGWPISDKLIVIKAQFANASGGQLRVHHQHPRIGLRRSSAWER